MKTIRILWQITGLLVLLAAFPVAAQNLQSYTLTLSGTESDGYSLIANQLNNGNNMATVIFTNTAGGIAELDGCYLFCYYDCADGYFFDTYVFDSEYSTGFSDIAGYPSPPPELSPGTGFFFLNTFGADVTVTFTGTPNIPVLPVSLACGEGSYYLLARQTNDIGTYENVTGYVPTEGAQVKTLAPGSSLAYVTNIYTGGAWTLGTPSLAVGQAAFFFIPSDSVVPFVPAVGSASFNRSGALQFPVSGTAGYQFRVWATTNLALSPVTETWTLVESHTFTGSPMVCTDAQTTNFAQRFYTVTVP